MKKKRKPDSVTPIKALARTARLFSKKLRNKDIDNKELVVPSVLKKLFTEALLPKGKNLDHLMGTSLYTYSEIFEKLLPQTKCTLLITSIFIDIEYFSEISPSQFRLRKTKSLFRELADFLEQKAQYNPNKYDKGDPSYV